MDTIVSLLRILFGLLAACLAAGVTQVLFVITPADMAALEPAALGERLQSAGTLALLAATQSAVFAAPFALIAVAVGEWQGIKSWLYYTLVGIAIAVGGFFVLHSAEGGAMTIVNDYALRAFLATGLVAGLVYWLLSGRRGGGGPKPIPARGT